MIFDKMAGIAERIGDKEVIGVINESRLFRIDEETSKRGRDEQMQLNEEQVKLINENFFLPFPITAIESPKVADMDDYDFCMVLCDIEKDQRGVGVRKFILCAEVNNRDTKGHGCVYMFMWGTTSYIPEINRYGCGVVRFYTWHEGGPYGGMGLRCLAKPGVVVSDEIKEVVANVSACVNPVMIWYHFINQPSHFIVSNEPEKHRSYPKGKIVRSPDRTTYTVLKPEAIKKRFRRDEIVTELHGTKAPHERRRHLRTYTAECYKKMKGQQRWIPACWVGPSEFKEGKRIYKVMLDV